MAPAFESALPRRFNRGGVSPRAEGWANPVGEKAWCAANVAGLITAGRPAPCDYRLHQGSGGKLGLRHFPYIVFIVKAKFTPDGVTKLSVRILEFSLPVPELSP